MITVDRLINRGRGGMDTLSDGKGQPRITTNMADTALPCGVATGEDIAQVPYIPCRAGGGPNCGLEPHRPQLAPRRFESFVWGCNNTLHASRRSAPEGLLVASLSCHGNEGQNARQLGYWVLPTGGGEMAGEAHSSRDEKPHPPKTLRMLRR